MFISTQLAELKAGMEHLGADQRQMTVALNVVTVWQARQEERNLQHAKDVESLRSSLAACGTKDEVASLRTRMEGCIEKKVLWAFGLGVALVTGIGTGTVMQFLHLAK